MLVDITVADPGFPVGGHGPHRGECGLPRQLHCVLLATYLLSTSVSAL